MKILMITDHGFEQGGVSTYVITLKRFLMKHAHEVRIMTSNEKSDLQHFNDYEFGGFKNTPLPLQMIYRIYNPFSAIQLKKVIKDFKPDIVHLHFIFGATSPSILRLLKGIPAIMTVHCETLLKPNDLNYVPEKCKHGPDSYCIKCDGLLRFYYNKLKYGIYNKERKNINLFLANSNFIESQLRKGGITNVKTVYLGINLLKHIKIQEYKNLLYIGRLSKQKGIEYLLRAMPAIIKKFPEVKLTILGKGEEKESLSNLCDDLKVSKSVVFVDFVPNNKIQEYYEKSTLVIVPSVCREAFGLIGPEAMSVGRPVIASKVGGIPEWLEDEKTGFLVEPGNSDQIADNVIKLFSNKKLLESMSKSARLKSEKFSIEKHVDTVEDIYKDLIEKHRTKKIVCGK